MRSTYSLTVALLLTTLVPSAMIPANAQANNHAKYVESVRKAVKSPTLYHELYNLVIQPEFNETVREAAKAGNDALVIEMLQAYSGQTSDKDKGGTALTWAGYYCDAPLLKILLDRGLDVNVKEADGDTPLHRALGIGRTDIVALLLAKDPNVNSANKSGDTPLMLAAGDNQAINTRAFLDRKADVNARNKQGMTPLMFAAKNGRLDNVKVLLSEGANVNLKDAQGNTALRLAEKSPGAPVTGFHDSPGYLDQASLTQLLTKAKRDQAEILQVLKRAGSN